MFALAACGASSGSDNSDVSASRVKTKTIATDLHVQLTPEVFSDCSCEHLRERRIDIVFAVVFVDGLRASANEHYRYEVHGTDSLRSFTTQLNATLAAGSFTDTSGNSGTARSD